MSHLLLSFQEIYLSIGGCTLHKDLTSAGFQNPLQYLIYFHQLSYMLTHPFHVLNKVNRYVHIEMNTLRSIIDMRD